MNTTTQKTSCNLNFDSASLIKNRLSDDLLSQVAACGSLRSSSCRSAVWRLLLRCLPYETADWETTLSRSRNEYRNLKKKNLIDPRDEKFSQDPQFNNPLAPIEHNPWTAFFEDNELRDIIGKDVSRTFPEIEFFQSDFIHKIMSDILLVYAKENPFINYRQGMHEILAPLIFVIFSDVEAHEHAKENDELKTLTLQEEDLLNCLFDKQFIENDSYILFSAFMLEVAKWYEDTTSNNDDEIAKPRKEPFMRVQDSTGTTRLMEDLLDVGQLLQEIDPTLAKHLNSLDIPPQLYGIRWLRLLFGRELPLHDLLFLWDVLLIDRPIGPLVKCVFVSLLVQIRHLLLSSDYGGCLQYLMRYPPIADIDSFVKLARHYRNPKKNAKPNIKSNNFTHITVTGQSHPNQARSSRPTSKPTSSSKHQDPSILTRLEQVKNTIRDRSNTVSVPNSPRKEAKSSDNWSREVQLMEEQVSCLQLKLNEKDLVCSQVATAIEQVADNVREARSVEQCERLAAKLIDLSKILRSKKNPESLTNNRNNQSHQLRPRSRDQISHNNEMVDLTRRHPKM